MKNVIRCASACLLICGAAPASALEVHVTPGTLASALDGNTDTSLRITGSIDVRDLIFLAENPGSVTVLDLGDVRIESYTYHRPLWQGHTFFAADALPEYIFMSAPFSQLTLPSTLTVLGEGCLAASAIESLTLPAALVQAGPYALYGCQYLRSVDMSASRMNTLPDAMFGNCSRLSEITLPSVLKNLGSEVFSGTALQHLDLSSADSLADFALSGMKHLESVTIGNRTVCGNGLLMGAVRLERLEGVPADVPDLFAAHCSALDADAVVSDATTLGACCVASAGGSMLHLTEGLSEVGPRVFDGMQRLRQLDATALGSRVPVAQSGAFDGIDCPSVTLVVGDDCKDVWSADPQWGRFNICTVSGVEEVIAGDTGLYLTMQGHNLTVTCAGGIDEVTVYSADGICLYTASPGGVTEVTVDCSAFDSNVLVAGARGDRQYVSRKFLVQK